MSKGSGGLLCKTCHVECESTAKFVEHYLLHSGQGNCIIQKEPPRDTPNLTEIILCSLCMKSFKRKDDVKEHMIKDHDCVPVGTAASRQGTVDSGESGDDSDDSEVSEDKDCWSKPVPFKELKRRLSHRLVHKCTFKGCIYSFASNDKRGKHESCHDSKEPAKVKDFKCTECKQDIQKWRTCSLHMWQKHKIDIDMFKCHFCDFKTVLAVKLFEHLQIHSPTKGFACSYCPKVFKQYSQLKCHSISHMDKKPNNLARWYSEKICEICNNVFSNAKTLSKHVKTVHNKIKPFICTVCGHKCARKSTLQIHMRQHTGEKPYACSTCEFKASDPSVWRKHMLRHHNEKGYVCNFCTYSSVQSAALKKHIRLKHPDEYQNSLKCDLCNFISVNQDRMERHKRCHAAGLIKDDKESLDNSTEKNSSPVKNFNVDLSSDCFLPMESVDSIGHDPPVDTGGVTIPAAISEETQFPNFNN